VDIATINDLCNTPPYFADIRVSKAIRYPIDFDKETLRKICVTTRTMLPIKRSNSGVVVGARWITLREQDITVKNLASQFAKEDVIPECSHSVLLQSGRQLRENRLSQLRELMPFGF
jgi:hypothetical protein